MQLLVFKTVRVLNDGVVAVETASWFFKMQNPLLLTPPRTLEGIENWDVNRHLQTGVHSSMTFNSQRVTQYSQTTQT